jgi:hypothetical protein
MWLELGPRDGRSATKSGISCPCCGFAGAVPDLGGVLRGRSCRTLAASTLADPSGDDASDCNDAGSKNFRRTATNEMTERLGRTTPQPQEVFMVKKALLALGVAMVIALAPGAASAQRFHGGGWHGGGWGGGWRGAGWRGGGWGWRGPAVGLGVGLGLASAAAWGSGWGWGPSPGWGPSWGAPGWSYASYGGCTTWRRVWTGWGWRVVPVNVCW